jgi:hypothetical protein
MTRRTRGRGRRHSARADGHCGKLSRISILSWAIDQKETPPPDGAVVVVVGGGLVVVVGGGGGGLVGGGLVTGGLVGGGPIGGWVPGVCEPCVPDVDEVDEVDGVEVGAGDAGAGAAGLTCTTVPFERTVQNTLANPWPLALVRLLSPTKKYRGWPLMVTCSRPFARWKVPRPWMWPKW